MQRLNAGGWVVSLKQVESPKARLLCFPFEGGNSDYFQSWLPFLRSGVELLGVEFPGKGARKNEPSLCQVSDVVDALLGNIGDDFFARPTIVFGHGVGGLVAYEWVTQLALQGFALPKRLLVSGCQAPSDTGSYFPAMSNLDDQDFFEDLINEDCLSQWVLNAPEEVANNLASIRADYAMRENFSAKKHEPLPITLQVLAGSRDRIPLGNLLEWQGAVRQPVHVCVFKGDHFFIEEDKENVLNHLNELFDELIVSGAYA